MQRGLYIEWVQLSLSLSLSLSLNEIDVDAWEYEHTSKYAPALYITLLLYKLHKGQIYTSSRNFDDFDHIMIYTLHSEKYNCFGVCLAKVFLFKNLFKYNDALSFYRSMCRMNLYMKRKVHTSLTEVNFVICTTLLISFLC